MTPDVTRQTLSRLRRSALEGHLAECRRIHNQLVMSEHQVAASESLQAQIDDSCERWPALNAAVSPVSQAESYRRFLRMIEFRLRDTSRRIPRPTALTQPTRIARHSGTTCTPCVTAS
ncbi:MAG: hypothetical protein CM1200mP2_57030 [Planctomycetaceae bacterium]|nr:MAG: hypothetical protein CM1200mP2_57030 [Planctomycetaceae bacterium]